MTRLNTTIAALILAALLAMPAQASMRQFCDAGGTCFVCPKGQPTCEIAYALSRATTPPSMDGAPSPPSPMPPGRVAAPPSGNSLPPPLHAPPPRQMTRDEERENVIRQGEAFCAKWPDDRVCHPLPDAAPPNPR